MRAIITHGLCTFYPLFEVNVFFFLKLWPYAGVSNQERIMMARIWYLKLNHFILLKGRWISVLQTHFITVGILLVFSPVGRQQMFITPNPNLHTS